MIVQLKQPNPDYSDLTPDQSYAVIGIEATDLRLLNDNGLPYLYPQDLFDVLDAREPEDWIHEVGDENERYAYPPSFNQAGFFEDYFDGKPQAVAAFWRVMNQRLVLSDRVV